MNDAGDDAERSERGAFGTILRRFRLDARLSQEELADRAHLSVESISALERGRRRAPYRETIRLIATAMLLSDAQRGELERAAKRSRPAPAPAADASGALPDPDRADRPHRRGNLVRALSSFHGRRTDRERLIALVAEHRLVSITGAGGIGKTRLALEIAWDLNARYADGIWFIDLAPLDDRDVVVRSVIAALDIPSSADGDEIGTLRHHLAGREAVLVVDNCEHVIDEVARLAETLLPSCPRVRMLTTSREPLHVAGERVYSLPSLDFPRSTQALPAAQSLEFSAVALYVERASAANAGITFDERNLSVVAETCRRLDGIALAIELAASQTAVLSPQTILAQLEQHFLPLSAGGRSTLPRRRTMHETVRWSYDRLAEPERRLFRVAAIFANGFTWDALREVGAFSAPSGDIAFESLALLVDKSLVVADVSQADTRYRLLAPLRAEALESLRAAGEYEETIGNFARWCAAFARRAHDDWETQPSAQWLHAVQPELDNLRAAVIWALGEGHDVVLGQRLTAQARRIWARLLPSEGRRWIGHARREVHAGTPADIVAELALAEAHVLVALQQYSASFEPAQIAEEYFESFGDVLAAAEARGFRGVALAQLGRPDEGEPLMQAAVLVYRELGARQLAAYGIGDRAIAACIRGDLFSARGLFRESLDLFRSLDNERGIASVAGNLAEVEFNAGNVEAALQLAGDALVRSRSGREARIWLENLAAYLTSAGRFDEARERARESILQSGMARADVDVAFALQHLAAIAALRPTPDANRRTLDLQCAAALLEFIDRRLASLEKSRQFTEQSEYNVVCERLKVDLEPVLLEAARIRGRLWSEDEAVEAALEI